MCPSLAEEPPPQAVSKMPKLLKWKGIRAFCFSYSLREDLCLRILGLAAFHWTDFRGFVGLMVLIFHIIYFISGWMTSSALMGGLHASELGSISSVGLWSWLAWRLYPLLAPVLPAGEVIGCSLLLGLGDYLSTRCCHLLGNLFQLCELALIYYWQEEMV